MDLGRTGTHAIDSGDSGRIVTPTARMAEAEGIA